MLKLKDNFHKIEIQKIIKISIKYNLKEKIK